MTDKVLVLGAGGHAKVVIDVLRAAGHGVVAVFDDDPGRQGEEFRGARIAGAIADAEAYAAREGVHHFIVAIGNNVARLTLGRRLEAAGLLPLVAVHPSAVIAPGVCIGGGTVVMPGVCINADTRIAGHAIINTGARVDHDCVIGEGVHLAPGTVLCGSVAVGELAFLGAGVTAIPGMRLGARCVVAAGGVVVRPVADDMMVRGVPARPDVE